MQHFKEQRVRIVEDLNSNYLLPSGTIVPHVEDFDKLEVNPSSSTRTAVMVDWARTNVPSAPIGVKNVPDCSCDVLTNFRFIGDRMLGFRVLWLCESLSFASVEVWESFPVPTSGQSSATIVSNWVSDEGLYMVVGVRCRSGMKRPYPVNLLP